MPSSREWFGNSGRLRSASAFPTDPWFFHLFLGNAYLQKGKMPEAIGEFQRALELEKDNAKIWSSLAYAYAVSGNKAEARKLLDHLKAMSEPGYVAPFNIAIIYLGLGD